MSFQFVKRGDLIGYHTPFKLSSPMSWLAWWIRLFTGAHCNHWEPVDICNGEAVVIAADHFGVRPITLENRVMRSPSKMYIFRTRQLSPENNLGKNLRSQWGDNYGYIQLLKFAWAIILTALNRLHAWLIWKFTGNKVKPKRIHIRSKKMRLGILWVCSTISAYARGYKDPHHYMPSDLENGQDDIYRLTI
jgi:hypothetical protein